MSNIDNSDIFRFYISDSNNTSGFVPYPGNVSDFNGSFTDSINSLNLYSTDVGSINTSQYSLSFLMEGSSI